MSTWKPPERTLEDNVDIIARQLFELTRILTETNHRLEAIQRMISSPYSWDPDMPHQKNLYERLEAIERSIDRLNQ
jgi:hypothetical protein